MARELTPIGKRLRQIQGIGDSFADRIEQWGGSRTLELLAANPYQLIGEVSGIGFKRADDVGRSFGVAPDSPDRAEAAVLHALQTLIYANGHTSVPITTLKHDALSYAKGCPNTAISTAIDTCILEESMKVVPGPGERCVTLPAFANLGKVIAQAFYYRAIQPGWEVELSNTSLTPTQHTAIKELTARRFGILTGLAGVGKTFVVGSLIRGLKKRYLRVRCSATTGRAAKRLEDLTDVEASTIHRLIGARKDGAPLYNETNHLAADVVIVDEASMLDERLAGMLVKALQPKCALYLVGDPGQLPPVAPGQVLKDCTAIPSIPHAELTEIIRQAKGSAIIVTAHAARNGRLPTLDELPTTGKSDLKFHPAHSLLGLQHTVLTLVNEQFRERPVQVLTAEHKGDCGTIALNRELQRYLNPADRRLEITHNDRIFRIGDRVMLTENRAVDQVFNGDQGIITAVRLAEYKAQVSFENGPDIWFVGSDLNVLIHSWAITIHKSQGSQYPATIVVMPFAHQFMWTRELLYTALTRAETECNLVLEPGMFQKAIGNVRTTRRRTGLQDAYRECVESQ